jgi:23S rRNA (cytosine1962-C5)-methyltransferase
MTYQLLDSGQGEKWEKFGPYSLVRPCPQAVWQRSNPEWKEDGRFSRDETGRWSFRNKIPSSWETSIEGVQMKIAPTEFGHLGVFPEHASLWEWMRKRLKKGSRVLNLFAYSGGASLAAAQEGAEVCHVDASKGMVDWANDNARLNRLTNIRWIVDDVMKFLRREIRRNNRYDGLIIDPPTFGRGAQGEVFKIEREIVPLLEACRALLSERPRFVIFTCHTPGFTPLVLEHLLSQLFSRTPETGEMLLGSPGALSIPSGSYGRIDYGNH